MVPSYRERLRVEGGVLAVAGVLASVALVAACDEATDRAASTAIQLAVVALALGVLGPLLARRWIAGAGPVQPGEELTGQPTPLWLPPLVLVVLAAGFIGAGEVVGAAGWDAGLRITLGCVLVGLAQALLLERIVAADEARTGRRYVRLAGSRVFAGTKLGFFRNERA